MNGRQAVNPFVPGRGHNPPYLAGREVEQGKLLDLLAYLQDGRGAPRDAVLSGPRGNGKTTLLRWLRREVEASGEDIDVAWLTPGEIPELDRLATALVPPSRFESLRPATLSLSAGIGRLGWELGGQSRSLTVLLTARCERRPLVLLLDEAHTLEREVGRALLNASQMASSEAPFLMVMAGTPGLQAHLDTMSATFWSRAEKLGIGRLDEAAAALALVRPLSEQVPAINFDEGALAHVVEESQRYPYFLQLWGAALWAAARSRAATRIDGSLVADAASEFGRQRTACYEDRREELERQELLAVAARVAGAFGGQATLHSRELNAVIAEALPGEASTAEVLECRDRLAMLGYVWKPPDAEAVWQPGIPSLMTYVAGHADPCPEYARSRRTEPVELREPRRIGECAPVKVFVSHSHADAELAAQVSKALRSEGLEVWDPDLNLLPGDNWAAEVARALEESDAMVVLMTEDALNSPWVRREMEYALGAKRYSNRLIPVSIGDRERIPAHDVPWIVRQLPWVELKDPAQAPAGVERIAEAIRNHS